MFDMTKWTTDRTTIEAQIREMKSRQRESHQPEWRGYLDGPALIKAKRRATLLYRIRAHRRGRSHTPGMSLAEQAEAIGDAIKEYERPGPTDLLQPTNVAV